jgi:GntR family transcriptional regulator
VLCLSWLPSRFAVVIELPSYLQLASVLRARIQSGEIGPRGPLPSITFLVQETGLAVGTVRKAIAVLIDEGLAYTVPGRGTFATARSAGSTTDV